MASYVGNASTIQLPVKCFEQNSSTTVVAPASFTPYLTVTFTPTISGFALASYTLQTLGSSGTAYIETQIYQDGAPVGNVIQTPMHDFIRPILGCVWAKKGCHFCGC